MKTRPGVPLGLGVAKGWWSSALTMVGEGVRRSRAGMSRRGIGMILDGRGWGGKWTGRRFRCVDPDEAEDGAGAACSVDAGFELVVECEGVLRVRAGHVDIESGGGWGCEVGEGEVVGGERADGCVGEELFEDGARGGAAIFRVGAAEDLVDEEEHRGGGTGIEDGGETFDLGEELGAALGERVGESDGGAEGERGDAQGLGSHGCSSISEYSVDADGAEQRGLAGHVGAA